MPAYKKPLWRSIAFGSILFTAVLCIAISVLYYYNAQSALYERYRSYITDILVYVDNRIDDDDLKQCVDTGKESEKYKELLLFMDQIMNDFSIHYLYAVKPLNLNETCNVMSVLSAEDDYNRYVDNEGNLYLGWISEDEYDSATAKKLFDIMEQDEIVFFVEKTGWSTDYTGAKALKDSSGEPYAVLCVDVDITELSRELMVQAARNNAVIILLGILYTVLFLSWARKNITTPVQLLEKGVVDFASRSHGQRNLEQLRFEEPEIKSDNEVRSLSKAITKMTEDMRDYVHDIISAEKLSHDMKELADTMSDLAVVDSLTGIWNKTAYMREINNLQKELAENPDMPAGLAMIDLNYLKLINDTKGHEKGDEALQNVAKVASEVFFHSPVFRLGGDEFAVILLGEDYDKAGELLNKFVEKASGSPDDEPWKKISASIGIALYDKNTDQSLDDVLKRADQNMYEMKKKMRAERSS